MELPQSIKDDRVVFADVMLEPSHEFEVESVPAQTVSEPDHSRKGRVVFIDICGIVQTHHIDDMASVAQFSRESLEDFRRSAVLSLNR